MATPAAVCARAGDAVPIATAIIAASPIDHKPNSRQRMGIISSSWAIIRYAPTPPTMGSRVGAWVMIAQSFYIFDLNWASWVKQANDPELNAESKVGRRLTPTNG
jgi:hypothetical protein